MKKYKITERKLSYFRRRVNHWIDVWGLYDWELDINTGNTVNGNLAELETNSTAKYAHIIIGGNWSIPYTEKEMDGTAHHEVLELLLEGLRKYCVPSDEMVGSNHEIIQRILNAFKTGKVR